MDRYKETFETWNKIASLYQDKFMDLNVYNESYDFICDALVKHHSKILEIGCGPGNISKYLLSKRADLDIYGIDIAPNMVELARRNNPSARFAVMDSRQIGEINTSFDAIVCGFCLPYLSEADSLQLISDVNQLLNNDGVLYLSFVEGDPSKSGFQTGSSGDRVYFYYYKTNDLIRLLTENNFEKPVKFQVVYKRSDSEHELHTVLIARKKTMPKREALPLIQTTNTLL